MKQCVLIGLCFAFLACKKEPPVEPPGQPTITLKAEDASCIEAWLRVTTADIPATIRLVRDGQRVSDLRLLTSDSLLVDEGLLPKRTYTYQLHKLAADSSVIETSASVQVTTMDTTSSNWSFTIDTLGVTSSVLYDVAIISDTNIWAVGELFLRDSSGQLDPQRYNAAHWDGRRWNIIRVPYIYQGSPFHSAIKCVFAFNDTDIWFSNSVHWNGQQFHNVDLAIQIFTGIGINKMWGNASTGELYVVGNSGTIAYSPDRGSTWRRLESGTGLPIKDIYGARNSRTGGHEILCVSADPNVPGHSQVLAIEGTMVSELATNPLWEPWAIWFVPRRRYISAGDGLWEAHDPRGRWVRNNQIPMLFKTSMAGQALNDIFVGGAFWLLAHWNGVHWQTYFPRISNAFTSVALKDNMMVAVGGIGNRAVAVIGRRH